MLRALTDILPLCRFIRTHACHFAGHFLRTGLSKHLIRVIMVIEMTKLLRGSYSWLGEWRLKSWVFRRLLKTVSDIADVTFCSRVLNSVVTVEWCVGINDWPTDTISHFGDKVQQLEKVVADGWKNGALKGITSGVCFMLWASYEYICHVQCVHAHNFLFTLVPWDWTS